MISYVLSVKLFQAYGSGQDAAQLLHRILSETLPDDAEVKTWWEQANSLDLGGETPLQWYKEALKWYLFEI